MRSKVMAYTAVSLFVLCAFTQVVEATALPTGSWTILGNGFFGVLQVNGVDGSGNLNATAYGQTTTGFYNSTSNHIVFLRQAGGDLTTVQTFTGDLFSIPSGVPGVCTYFLAGTFTGFIGTGATASHNNLGWIALITAGC